MFNKPIIFGVRVYKTSRSFNVPKAVRDALRIRGGDSIHLIVKSPSGEVLFEGRKTLKSGAEIYGIDISHALLPGSSILVHASNPMYLENDAEAYSFNAQERNAGFHSNAEIRLIVEKHAMSLSEEKLRSQGFENFLNTSAYECYDFTCERKGSLYYVEVKGTQGAGNSVIVTANEVEHAQMFPHQSIAVVVHDIKVTPVDSAFQVSGGKLRVCFPWVAESRWLKPLQYLWTVSECEPN